MTYLVTLPYNALVLLVGSSGSGKSRWAASNFEPSQIVSSDRCRWMIADSEEDQNATKQAFEVLHKIVDGRLTHKRLTVVDATNLKLGDRKPFLDMAARHKVPVYAVIFDADEALTRSFNIRRQRQVPDHVLHKHAVLLHQAKKELAADPALFHRVFTITVMDDMTPHYGGAGVRVEPRPSPLKTALAHEGFDVIGDVHGCITELMSLLGKLGWSVDSQGMFAGPVGRCLVFTGDLTDRGPESAKVLELVLTAVHKQPLLVHMVLGNHDNKLLRALHGNNVKIGYGLGQTLQQLSALPDSGRLLEKYRHILDTVPYQLLCLRPRDGEQPLWVTHAGIAFDACGKEDKSTLSHCIYGYVSGKTTDGFPDRDESFRKSWHDGQGWQVHGHIVTDTPRPDEFQVYNIDGGCCFGGQLNALRYPELELVSVPALQAYCPRQKSDHIIEESTAA